MDCMDQPHILKIFILIFTVTVSSASEELRYGSPRLLKFASRSACPLFPSMAVQWSNIVVRVALVETCDERNHHASEEDHELRRFCNLISWKQAVIKNGPRCIGVAHNEHNPEYNLGVCRPANATILDEV